MGVEKAIEMGQKLFYDKSTALVMRLGSALVKAVQEHGIENSFAFSELVGSDAMQAGKAVRRQWGAFCLNVAGRLAADFGPVSKCRPDIKRLA
jgi:hypothetical protein